MSLKYISQKVTKYAIGCIRFEFAEKQYTLKDLGGERPEIPSITVPVEEDTTEASTTTTAAE